VYDRDVPFGSPFPCRDEVALLASTDSHAWPQTDLPRPSPPELPEDPLAQWPELRRVGTRLPLRAYLSEVWRRREFAVTVPLGELKAQNQDTVLGALWHLLNPLMLIVIYWFIFGVVLGVEGGTRRGVDNYLPFLIVGVITFNYTRSSIQTGARMIVKNRKLVQSINFPRAILPMSAMVSETLSHVYAIPVMFALLLIIPNGPSPMWSWLLLVPILVVHAMFNLGLSMAVARFSFHFRDAQQFLPYLLRLYLYMSGVLIPITGDLIGNDVVRTVLQINPMYNIIEMAREAVLDGGIVYPHVWLLGTGWAVLLLLFGFWYFRRAENEYGRV
jgi:teichoic acid transport system permease protein